MRRLEERRVEGQDRVRELKRGRKEESSWCSTRRRYNYEEEKGRTRR